MRKTISVPSSMLPLDWRQIERFGPGEYVLTIRDTDEGTIVVGEENIPTVRVSSGTLAFIGPLHLPPGEYRLIVDNDMPYGVILSEEAYGPIHEDAAGPGDGSADDGGDPGGSPGRGTVDSHRGGRGATANSDAGKP
jgi:hypothetical protein